MTKQQRKTIEKNFYNYERNRALAADYISDRIVEQMGVDYSKERVKTSRTNGVEKKVITTIDEAERLHKWCIVYEKTKERFKWTLKDKLMEMRYEDRNHQVCICDVIGISDRTVRYWLEDILQKALMWAEELNLL